EGGPTAGFGGRVPGPLVAMGTEPDAPSVIRAQLSDPTPPQPFKPATALKTPLALPSLQNDLLPKGNPLLPVSNTVGAQQAAALLDGSEVRVKIRAWVNGRPIFNDELMQMVRPAVHDLIKMPEPQRSEKIAEVFTTA